MVRRLCGPSEQSYLQSDTAADSGGNLSAQKDEVGLKEQLGAGSE